MEVWCVPSATQVPRLYQSQNTFSGIRIFVTLFFKYFFGLQIQRFSENIKRRLGKIREDNIKIDARKMKFEGV